MAVDTLKPEKPAKRPEPQLQWNLAECRALVERYEMLIKANREHYSARTHGQIRDLIVRFNFDCWDEESRVFLARNGYRFPTSIEEVKAAEEAMKDEVIPPLPEELKDPYEIIRKHPEVFGDE